jgi:hypothetical protein
MSEETVELRLSALEECHKAQTVLNKQITDSLNRIELQLASSIAKACPLPGHCVVLENNVKSKWEHDKDRFARLEARAAENDAWREGIEKELAAMAKILNRGLGGIALLVFVMPFVTWFAINYLVNK